MNLITVIVVGAALLCLGAVAASRLLTRAETRGLKEQIRKRGGEVNCHTLAEQYVRNYQAERMHTFHREEEERLSNYLVGRFGVFEDTAAEIVAANWPFHRSPLPYKGVGATMP